MFGESWLSAVRRDDVCVGGGAALGNSHPPSFSPWRCFTRRPASGVFPHWVFFTRMARDRDGFRRSGVFSGLGVPQWVGGGGLHVLPLGSSRFVILFRSLLGRRSISRGLRRSARFLTPHRSHVAGSGAWGARPCMLSVISAAGTRADGNFLSLLPLLTPLLIYDLCMVQRSGVLVASSLGSAWSGGLGVSLVVCVLCRCLASSSEPWPQ